jgi:hypothetical protein
MPDYMSRVERLLSTSERQAVIDYLAVSPKTGVLMQGTGQAAFVSFVGHATVQVKAVEYM